MYIVPIISHLDIYLHEPYGKSEGGIMLSLDRLHQAALTPGQKRNIDKTLLRKIPAQ